MKKQIIAIIEKELEKFPQASIELMADQIVVAICQPDKELVEIIDEWAESLVSELGEDWKEQGEEYTPDLAASIDAWYRARPQQWQISVETLRKLKEQRALARTSGRMVLNDPLAAWLDGFDGALRILNLLDAVAGEGAAEKKVQP